MPRLLPSMETAKYRNLRTLLQWDRTKAKETVLKLQEDSKQIVSDVEEEMIRLHGFKWKVKHRSPLPSRTQPLTTSLVDMDRVSCCP